MEPSPATPELSTQIHSLIASVIFYEFQATMMNDLLNDAPEDICL
jgi:hypothetical protein